MTNWIYFDNFRGFQATLIPLASVNFLVGENSTGKTSVLSLIALLGEPRFWFEQDFNCGAINLGRYRDIASTGVGVKGRFRIGYVTPVAADQEQPAEQYEAVLMTFEEIDNNPLISHFAYAGQSGVITVEFNGKQTRYHYDRPDQESWTEQRALGLFGQWIANSVESKSDQTLEREETLNRRLALTAVNRLVQRLYDESMGVDESNRTVAHAPAFASNIAWLAPIRSKPRRTYDEYKADFDPEGEHTPYLIRRLLRQGKASAEFRRFIERFGQESGLFDTLEIKGFGKEAASGGCAGPDFGLGRTKGRGIAFGVFGLVHRVLVSLWRALVPARAQPFAARMGNQFFCWLCRTADFWPRDMLQDAGQNLMLKLVSARRE